MVVGFLFASAKKLVKSSNPIFWADCCWLFYGFCADCLLSDDLFWILKADKGFEEDLVFLRVSVG